MKKLEETFSWSRFYSHRKHVRGVYPSVYGLKIKKKILDVIVEELKDGDKILDVGASNRELGRKIIAKFPSITYKTMDIDKAQSHDYYSLEEITESFNLLILFLIIICFRIP